jgi:hypothetical protein
VRQSARTRRSDPVGRWATGTVRRGIDRASGEPAALAETHSFGAVRPHRAGRRSGAGAGSGPVRARRRAG